MKASQEIEALAGKLADNDIHEDEPLFCLRARDATASLFVRMWAVVARAIGAPAHKASEALGLAEMMDRWQVKRLPGRPETQGDVSVSAGRDIGPTAKFAADILSERLDQLCKWSESHDDSHSIGEMAIVASELIMNGVDREHTARDPWDLIRKHPRRLDQLKIAGALVIAEMERISRLPVIVD